MHHRSTSYWSRAPLRRSKPAHLLGVGRGEVALQHPAGVLGQYLLSPGAVLDQKGDAGQRTRRVGVERLVERLAGHRVEFRIHRPDRPAGRILDLGDGDLSGSDQFGDPDCVLRCVLVRFNPTSPRPLLMPRWSFGGEGLLDDQGQDGFLGVHAVLRLVEDRRLGSFDHSIGHLLAPVARQAVHEDRILLRQ